MRKAQFYSQALHQAKEVVQIYCITQFQGTREIEGDTGDVTDFRVCNCAVCALWL